MKATKKRSVYDVTKPGPQLQKDGSVLIRVWDGNAKPHIYRISTVKPAAKPAKEGKKA